MITEISRLSRNPAAAFAKPVAAAIPDLLFECKAGDWTVRSLLNAAQQLTLRPAVFATALQEAADAQSRSMVRRKWRGACALHQAAGMRDTTIAALGKQLQAKQRAGLDNQFARLAPMTQRELAKGGRCTKARSAGW